MTEYEVKDDTGKVHRITAVDPESACRRVADLHQVAVVAVRESRRPRIIVGVPPDADF